MAVFLLAACSPSDPGSRPLDTLADDSWPTEVWSSEASAAKKTLLQSFTNGTLDAAAAAEILTVDFRGEDFAKRAKKKLLVRSGLAVAEWHAVSADLDGDTFRKRWNVYLAELGEVLTLESHTWEVQLRAEPAGGRAFESKEAMWILARRDDGRLQEERFYLVLDVVEVGGSWRIRGVRSADGRTVIGPGPYFRDVTAQVMPPGYDQIGAQIYTDGGPVLSDFDGDGDVDLFLPRLHAPARLYQNDGKGTFDDVTAAWGLELKVLSEGSNSGLFLDFDGDGRTDLVIGHKRRGLLLLRNEGGTFRDVTGPTPLAGAGEWESLAAADYDGDGLVDIFMCNYNLIDSDHQPESYVDARDGRPNVLLRNLGGGRFEDVTEAVGMASDRHRWSYAAAWADYDRDGDVDLYVANDYGPNSLYRNRGDGTFETVTAETGAEDAGNGMGVTWADVDGDLLLDLYVSNMQSFAGNRITRLKHFPGTPEQQALYRRFAKGNTLLHNRGDGSFEDYTEKAGVKGAFWAWGNLAFDYDADRDLDLFVCGGFYTGAQAADT